MNILSMCVLWTDANLLKFVKYLKFKIFRIYIRTIMILILILLFFLTNQYLETFSEIKWFWFIEYGLNTIGRSDYWSLLYVFHIQYHMPFNNF